MALSGSRAQLNELAGSLRGTLEIADLEWEGGPLDLTSVRWEQSVLGIDYRWKAGTPPELVAERFSSQRIQLRPEDLEVDVSQVDPHF